jgi:glucosamine-6-phosphate deaminase
MEVIVRPDAEAAVALVAQLMADRLRAKPGLVLGLATGRTMERVYDRLVALGPSFDGVTSFNLDEYIGLEPDDPNSYRSYMRAHLLDRVGLPAARARLPEAPVGADPAALKAVAAAYEDAIRAAGGIDLQLLGIGETGHIGFNEPGSALLSRTRDKTLSATTRAQNAGMFGGDPAAVPTRAMTMGVGTILDAREVILLATGAHKAGIVARAVEGPVTSMVTASALQLHPACKVVLDEEAASALEGRAYYDAVFLHEPEWEPYR